MNLTSIKITATGVALPSQSIDNQYFEEYHNLPEGTIFEMLGVKSRRKSSDENLVEQGARAVQNALDDANFRFEDLDMMINASVSIAYCLPNTATMIQRQLGKEKSGVPCIDINLSCLSWLSALEMAAGLLQTKRYRRILIVSNEQPSKILNPQNIETHSLFGDAAAAVIVEYDETGEKGIIQSKFQTYSDGWNLSIIPAGGLLNHQNHHSPQAVDYTFQMQNQRLLLYSLKKLREFFDDFIQDWSSIDKIVPHQASRAGIDFFTHFYDVKDKMLLNLENRGNCVAASIPLAFCENLKNGNIKPGETVLFAGTAAGISIGAVILKI
jgi:3-oxoacyl-[acyl-carrier-protein] synthase III